MRVLLLYPQWTETYGSIAHFARKASKWPPLNLAYLAALAEARGHTVDILDGEAEEIPRAELIARSVAFAPDVIGITATTPFYHLAVALARGLKEVLGAPIAIGGPHVTVLRDAAFDECFDFAAIGEGDRSWPELLEALEAGGDVSKVRGILFRDGDNVIYTGAPDPISDVDSLPLPARHLLRSDCYVLGTLQGDKRFTAIQTVRGCPFTCIFCSTKVFGKDTRRRSADNVVAEMEACIEQFGTEHFMFLDDTLTLDRGATIELCERMIARQLPITFEGSTRADAVDEELVDVMARAGLIRLSFGLEAVAESVRDLMKKRVPLDAYQAANELTNRHGIETLNSCMIGLPGDDEASIRETLAFLRSSRAIKQANISIAVPYPGTELFEMARAGKHGLELMSEDFADYRRYNAAVMKVGDLTPEDLIRIQNEAFASIYMAPWRWEPMIRKSGIGGAMLTVKRLMRCIDEGQTQFLTNQQLGVSDWD